MAGVRLPVWLNTVNKVIEVYNTDFKLQVCDDTQKIKDAADKQRKRRLRDCNSTEPTVVTAAERWFESEKLLLDDTKRQAVLDMVYESAYGEISYKIQAGLATGSTTLDQDLYNSLLDLIEKSFSLSNDLAGRFLKRYMQSHKPPLKIGGPVIRVAGLEAIKFDYTDNAIRLSWKVSAGDCDSVEIIRDKEMSPVILNNQPTHFEDKSVVLGTWYNYKLRPRYKGVEGTPYPIPAICPADVTNPRAKALEAQISLKWDMPVEATSVMIFRAEDKAPVVQRDRRGPRPGNQQTECIFNENGTEHEDANVREGAKYFYCIIACFGSGLYSPGVQMPVQMEKELLPPRALQAVYLSSSPRPIVKLNWAPPFPGFVGNYALVRGEGGIVPIDPQQEIICYTKTTEYQDKSARPGKRYCYAVFSEQNARYSRKSAVAPPVDILADVRKLSATTGDQTVNLTWQQPPNVNFIIVTRKEDREPSNFEDGERFNVATRGHFNDTNVRNDQLYYYRVFCVYKPGKKRKMTNGVTVHAQPAKPPTAVKDFRVEQDGMKVVCSWTPPEHGKVIIYRSEKKPSFARGKELKADQVASIGEPIACERNRAVDRAPVDGKPHYTIVTVAGANAVVGGTEYCSVVPDISDLRHLRRGDELMLSWNWPDNITKATIVRRTDRWPQGHADPKAQCRSFTKDEYKKKGERYIDIINSRESQYFYTVYAQSKSTMTYSPGLGRGCKVKVPWTSMMELSYQVQQSSHRHCLHLNWSIKNLDPEFGGFALLADHSSPPKSMGQGIELYRWQPEENDSAGEYETTLSLQLVRDETHWDEFYCRLVLLKSEKNTSVTVTHPNTCRRISVDGAIERLDVFDDSQRFRSGIPKEVICPICFKKFNTIDMLYSDYQGADPVPGHYSLFAKKWGLKRLSPPTVNGKIYREKQCPEGHRLPSNAGLQESFLIGMVGASSSGKSHYVASLIDRLKGQVAQDLKGDCMHLTDETRERYLEEFYLPLFKDNVAIDQTIGKRPPLIYDFTFKAQRAQARSVNLALYDTAGENFKDQARVQTMVEYLGVASGIIFVIDPFQIQSVRQTLPKELVKTLPELDFKNTPNGILANIITSLENGAVMEDGEPLNVPVAVVLTKCDVLLEHGLIDANRLWCTNKRHIACFDKTLHDDMAGMMGEYIMKWELPAFNNFKTRFPNHAFFGLSATGCNPDQAGRYRYISPWRVEDPVLWLLAKMGVLPVRQ